jgi:hypothetical protein
VFERFDGLLLSDQCDASGAVPSWIFLCVVSFSLPTHLLDAGNVLSSDVDVCDVMPIRLLLSERDCADWMSGRFLLSILVAVPDAVPCWVDMRVPEPDESDAVSFRVHLSEHEQYGAVSGRHVLSVWSHVSDQVSCRSDMSDGRGCSVSVLAGHLLRWRDQFIFRQRALPGWLLLSSELFVSSRYCCVC